MEKNELSRIPDSDTVVSPDNPDDPNDPVVTTDDPNGPTTNGVALSRIPDSDAVVSPDNSDDPNDPVVTTDDPNDPATDGVALSRIPDSDAVVSPDNPGDPNDPVVTTDDPNGPATNGVALSRIGYYKFFSERVVPKVNFIERGKNIDLESSSSKHEQHQPNVVPVVVSPDVPERAGPSEVKFKSPDNRDMESYPALKEIEIEIEQLEKILGASLKDIHEPVSQCCIYMVPKDLRKINEEAYTPQVISIGPFHYGKRSLIEMEKQKLRYMLEFHKRVGVEKLKGFKRFIEEFEQLIRNYYQENSGLESSEFVIMILRDAVFIIEFFLKNTYEFRSQKVDFDFFLDTNCVKAAITRDLQLLENQLPYFLLQNLFEQGAFLNFTKEDYPGCDPFLILCHRFFFDKLPNNEIQHCQIQHFTDLRRYFLLMDFPSRHHKQGENVRDLPTATKLHGSGVKFKKGNEGGSSLEINCEYVPRAMQIPGFKGCEIPIPFIKELRLQIPRFEIDDKSECLYRNMMALELCHYPSNTHICNFIILMDFLINTEKDVDLFVEEGIIFGLLGDNAAVANMFNNLGLQITPSKSVYHDICMKLKEHYDGHFNRTMANLNTVYFGDIWTGTATGAAIILLVLTFIQAVCSILSLL